MTLDYFKDNDDFYKGLQQLFSDMNIPINYLDDKPIIPKEILKNTYKENNPAYQLMKDVYIVGMVDDAAFKGNKSIDLKDIKSDYDVVVIL